jgi:hypothetical protein
MFINEQEQMSEVEKKLEKYSKNSRYLEAYDKLKDSAIAKMGRSSESHLYGLGSQLEKFDNFYNGYLLKNAPAHVLGNSNRIQESGSLNDLAQLPKLAYDLLITNMGNNPISVFAGFQPIASSNGGVYVKTLVADNTRGNTTAGQIVSSPIQNPDVFTDYFIGSNNPQVTIATTAASSPVAGPYNTTLTRAPLRKNNVKVKVTASIYGQDDGNGYIIGRGLEGTINYTTGDITVNFTVASGSIPVSTPITVTYTSNLEESGQYAKLNLQLTKIDVQAEPFAVGQDFGIFQSYEIEQQFGRLAQDDSMNDLSQAMMAEISNKIINKMFNQVIADGAGNQTTWDATPPVGTSKLLHRGTLIFAVSEAEQKIYLRTGRAVIDFVLASPAVASYFSTLVGFESINIVSQGAHIFGKVDNRIIVRCPQIPQGEAVMGFSGTGMFDRPAVWASYMPMMFIHPNIPMPNNLLKVQGAVVSYGAAELVISRFLTRFTILNYATNY